MMVAYQQTTGLGATVAGDSFVIEGGHRLKGRVRTSGNKNATVHAMAATLLTPEDCYLENVPAIGDVRFMVEILRSLGAAVDYTSPSSLRINASKIHTLAAPSDLATHLRGSRIFLDYPSVIGTQNLMLAATMAKGHTTLVNVASEPEIACLAQMLNEMGARIAGAGTQTIEIDGVGELHGITYRIIPDRIEAGTLAIAAAIPRGEGDGAARGA